MKSKIIALALFAFTTATVALLPAYQTVGGITPPTRPLSIPSSIRLCISAPASMWCSYWTPPAA